MLCAPAKAFAQLPTFGVLVDLAWRPTDGHAYGVTSSGDVFANPGYCGQWAWAGHLPPGESPVRILDGDGDAVLFVGCASGTFYAVSGSLPTIALTACSSINGVAQGTFVDAVWRHDSGAYAVTSVGEVLAAPGGCGPWALVGHLPDGEIPVCMLDNDRGASIEIGCRSGRFYEVTGSIPAISTTLCSSMQSILQGELVDVAWRRAIGYAFAVSSTGGIYSNPGFCGAWAYAGNLPNGEHPACVLDGDVGGSMDIGCRSGSAYTVFGGATNVAVGYCSGLRDLPTAPLARSWGMLKVRYR